MPTKLIARAMRAGGFAVAYGSFLLSASVVAYQAYHWLHDGQWHPIGIDDGLRAVLPAAGSGQEGGSLAHFARWLAAPTDWLGWHEVLVEIPVSVALFLVAVAGNFAYVFGSDLLQEADESPPSNEEVT